MSNRFSFLKKSEIREMSIECDKVGGINLSQGICDFPLIDELKNAALEAMEEGYNHYTRHDGEYILRKAISDKARRYNKIEADPERNIVVTCGATGALFCVASALFEPEDEIILFEPFYGYHVYTLLSLNLKPVYVKLNPPEWRISIEDIKKKITNRTKAILINTPLNPTGKVFSRNELQELAGLCNDKDLLVITDEIYEYILYDDLKHISPAALPELKDRTFTISGYSKTFSITGWRIGYSICPDKYVEEIGHIADLLYVCAPAPLQYATAKAIELLDDSYYQKLKSAFTKKRTIICDTLNSVGLNPYIPQGAYYVMADISRLPGVTGKEKAMWLLNRTGVAVVPGEAFLSCEKEGYTLARFCFAKDDSVLQRACDSIIKYL